MMKLGNALGLLGLLGIVALIIIYIIKPNYQQRFVSSTYVWRLSLRYKRKRVPINKLRNILLIVCQVLLIAISSVILALPLLSSDSPKDYVEKVIVIDASANMNASNGHDELATTRFDRAIEGAKQVVGEVLSAENGAVSVIVSGGTASVLARRVKPEEKDALLSSLDECECTFGAGDIKGAMGYAEEIINEALDEINYQPEVLYYTGINYISAQNVTLVNVADEGEWNVAVLEGSAYLNGEYCYDFSADVAVYGKDASVNVGFEVFGVNGDEEQTVLLHSTAACMNDETATVTVTTASGSEDYSGGETDSIYSFDYARIFIEGVDAAQGGTDDSFGEDNEFFIYGEKKPELTVQYASSLANTFSNSVITSWRRAVADDWTIVPTEVDRFTDPQTSGFDIYIFEHEKMPAIMPDDGLVILIDPVTSTPPTGSGLNIIGQYETTVYEPFFFSKSATYHPILEHFDASSVWVTKYVKMSGDDGYMELLYCNDDPVLLLKDDPDAKVLVWAFDVNRSNGGMEISFPLMMLDVLQYFFPRIVEKSIYEVGDVFSFNSLAATADLVDPKGQTRTFETFPQTCDCSLPGTYCITQYLLSGKQLDTRVFVKVASTESNITRTEDVLYSPVILSGERGLNDIALTVYFAAAMLALLLLEWWLHSRTQA